MPAGRAPTAVPRSAWSPRVVAADVDRLYSEVRDAGYAGSNQPYDAFWGARHAIVEDPDGNAGAR